MAAEGPGRVVFGGSPRNLESYRRARTGSGSAIGLAQLGEPAGVEWLLHESEENEFGVGSMSIFLDLAPHARDSRGNLRESSLLALADLFGVPPSDHSAPFQAWWAANVDREQGAVRAPTGRAADRLTP